MRYLSMFSGIEAATAAWHPLGWQCAAVSEIEPFPCAVLAHHYPHVPNLGDVSKITEEQIAALGEINLVVAGSPCQDLSVAGKRKGMINADGTVTRSGLFFTAINIFQWARKHCGARWFVWENVPGAYSSNKGRDFAAVVEFLAGLDDVAIPENGWGAEGCAVGDNGLLEWACLDAQWFGVAQRRRRVFAVLDTGDWSHRPPVLLERHSLRGDTAPRRESGQNIAPTLSARTKGGGGIGTDFDLDGGLIAQPYAVANCLTQRMYKGINSTLDEGQTPVVSYAIQAGATRTNPNSGPDGVGVQESIAYTLEARQEVQSVAYGIPGNWIGRAPENGGNAVEPMVEVSPCQTGTDRHGVVIAFPANLSGTQCASAKDISPSLCAINPTAIAFDLRGREGGAMPETTQPDTASIRAANGGSSRSYVAIGWSEELTDSEEVAGTLQRGGQGGRHDGVMTPAMQVRRLTPRECERLQGFPDDFTRIEWRNKAADVCPDGPRYKALGNSMAVPVMAHIGQKIKEAQEYCA